MALPPYATIATLRKLIANVPVYVIVTAPHKLIIVTSHYVVHYIFTPESTSYLFYAMPLP